jgi:hypothetical protein
LQVGVDLLAAVNFNAMGDAIFFAKAAGVDEALRELAFISGNAKTEVDARVGGWLNLREHVIAVQRNPRFCRDRL